VPSPNRFRSTQAALCASAMMISSLSGCAMGPDFTAPKIFAPSSWFAGKKQPVAAPVPSQAVETPPNPQWWEILHDPVLTGLEERLAATNLDVRIASIRLGESRAQAAVIGADRLPTLGGSGSYTREHVSSEGVLGLFGGSQTGGSFSSGAAIANGTSGTSGAYPLGTKTHGINIPSFDVFQYGFDASWEADIWGRVRREVESAKAQVDAGREGLRGTLVVAQAELARDYITLRGAQSQLTIARKNIVTAKQSLELSRQRFKGGLTTELDVVDASEQLANTEATIPTIRNQESQLINAISLLLGEGPRALTEELAPVTHGPDVPPMPPLAPIGLPADLARRRPDIREAEAKLHSATAEIGVAIADFYPKLTLDGSFGFQALQFKNLSDWNARQFGYGPSISVPIFEGGRLRATLQLRKAEQQEAAVQYQQTVLMAWHDVDNALTAYTADQERAGDLQRVVEQTHRALELAQERYREGVADFLNVLDAERNVLTAEQQLADSITAVGTDLVALYKALGGGWETTFPPAIATPKK